MIVSVSTVQEKKGHRVGTDGWQFSEKKVVAAGWRTSELFCKSLWKMFCRAKQVTDFSSVFSHIVPSSVFRYNTFMCLKKKILKISALFDMGLETKCLVLFWRKICCCSDEDGEWSWENRSSAGNKIMFSLSITTSSSSSSYDDDNDDDHHHDDDLWPDKAVPAGLLWCWGDAGEQGLVKKILIFKKNYLQLDAHPPPVE